MREKRRTGASLLLCELIDQNGDAEGVDGLGSDKKVVMITDNKSQEGESGHTSHDGDEGLDLGRLAAEPGHGRPDRTLCTPGDTHRRSERRKEGKRSTWPSIGELGTPGSRLGVSKPERDPSVRVGYCYLFIGLWAYNIGLKRV